MNVLDSSLPPLLTELQRLVSNLSTYLSSHPTSNSLVSHPAPPLLSVPIRDGSSLLPSVPPVDPFSLWHSPAPISDAPKSYLTAASLPPDSSPSGNFTIHQSLPARISSFSRLRSKLRSLNNLSKSGSCGCFRCGDSGHRASSCHNAVVCFACTKLGHRSSSCPELKMSSSTSTRPPLTESMKQSGSSLPIMRFACTQSIRDFDVLLRRGVVITDSSHKGAVFINSGLQDRFPIKDFSWQAIPLTDVSFLLYPPDPEWHRIALEEKHILLGDTVFPLEAFDPIKHDRRWEPLPFWVKIYGLPSHLLQGLEFDRLVSELGGSILQVDPLSKDRANMKYLRLKIGVSARSNIPPCRKLLFTGPDGTSRYYWIQFVVEGEGRIKKRNRPVKQGVSNIPNQPYPRPSTQRPNFQPSSSSNLVPPLPPMPHPSQLLPPFQLPPPLPPLPHPIQLNQPPPQPIQPPLQPIHPPSQSLQPTSQPLLPIQLPPLPIQPILPPPQPIQPPSPPLQPTPHPLLPIQPPPLPIQPPNQPIQPTPQPLSTLAALSPTSRTSPSAFQVTNGVSEHNSFSVLANLSDPDIPTSHILVQDPWTLHTVPPSPVSSSVDRQNPWEVALHQENEKKRKGKAAATLDEPRNSLRVKLNQMVGDPKDVHEGAAGKPLVKAKTGSPRSTSGGRGKRSRIGSSSGPSNVHFPSGQFEEFAGFWSWHPSISNVWRRRE